MMSKKSPSGGTIYGKINGMRRDPSPSTSSTIPDTMNGPTSEGALVRTLSYAHQRKHPLAGAEPLAFFGAAGPVSMTG
jgi:hypothetical protein